MAQKDLIGKKGQAEVIEIFAAVTNTDLDEGRGRRIDHSYHPNQARAKVATIGIGVQGNDGYVESRLAVKFGDETILLLSNAAGGIANTSAVRFSMPSKKQITVARIKHAEENSEPLTAEEKKAFGLN